MITGKDLEAARQKLQDRMDAATGGASAEEIDSLNEVQIDAAAVAQLVGLDITQTTVVEFSQAMVRDNWPDIPDGHPLFAALCSAVSVSVLTGLQAAATAREAEGASQ